MLGLFSGPPVAAANTAAANASKRKKANVRSGTSSATTIAASELGTIPGQTNVRSAHTFNAPEAEEVLGLRRLLVKVVGAKDIPASAGARRSCSAEVQLVDEVGAPLGGGAGALHDRTGPPNHFTTVKDTAPVWNAEFVADLPTDLIASGAALRFDVWDDAASPPAHLGSCHVYAADLQRMCMREEERTMLLERSSTASASAVAQAASADLGPGSLRVRIGYVDVRAAMAMLSQAEQMAASTASEREAGEARTASLEAQLRVLSNAVREEEERATFFSAEANRGNVALSGAAANAAREREEVRVRKAQEDAATVLSALKEEKRQALEAVISMHNTSLAAFKEDLASHALQEAKLREEAVAVVKADVEVEREQLARQREESRALAFANAEEVIQSIENNARAEVEALDAQHAAALSAMQKQLGEQLERERTAMEQELESRSRLVATQLSELKALHAQQLGDMKASMTATIEDYEQSALDAQKSAREEVRQAIGEHDAQLRTLRAQLAEAREGGAQADEARRQLAIAKRDAAEAAERHRKEVDYVKETLKTRSEEQQAQLEAMGVRLKERGEALEKARVEEVDELRAELSSREVTQAAAHKEEVTCLKASYNDAIDRLKAEMLALIEERAASAETSKREYEAELLTVKRKHHEEIDRLRSDLLERERETARTQEAAMLAKVSEYENAVAALRESTLAAFAEEQRKTDGTLPRLQERLEGAAREHERAANDLLKSMEEKMASQAELHSGEYEGMRARYEAALADARTTSEAALKQLDAQAQAREAELVARLEAQATVTAEEVTAANARGAEALSLSMARSREEREAAVEQCNTHWMGMLSRQKAAAAEAAEKAEKRHKERLEEEVEKVTTLAGALQRQAEETSMRLKEMDESIRASALEELNGASHRHERLLKQSIAKLQQEMSLRLEEERRRWQSQAELASRAASEQQRQALALLDETHRTAIEFAESQITQLSDALTSERAAHQREIDERVSELAGKHAAELEEQHAWYVSQMATFEKDRDSAIDQLTTHLDTSLAALREQQREALEVERSSLDRAMARLQAEQASTMDALANESSRELAAVQETVERERRESAARLAEDQEHRARVNQADLRRLEQHTAEMRNLLVAEREQWAARETKARAHGAEVLKEVREAAYQQATVEHDRVLREAAAHGAELTQQHEAALAAALAQKDEQLGARLSEYEGQLAHLVTERAELQSATRDALAQATAQCEETRAELRATVEGAEAALREKLGTLHEGSVAELQSSHEAIQASQQVLQAVAVEAVHAQAAEGQRAMLGRLGEIQQEATARHRHSAAALGEAVKALHVRRESELGTVAAEHATALGWLREEYEGQLRRQAKLADEVRAAERAKAEQARSELVAEHEARVSALQTEKQKLAEERAKGWAHLPLPDVLRNALDEGVSELKAVHAEQVTKLNAEHDAQLAELRAERDRLSAEATTALAQQSTIAEHELGLSLSEAKLQAEEERTRFMEETNARVERELQMLRDEQAEEARRFLAGEAKRIAAEEAKRVSHEMEALRRQVRELQTDNERSAAHASALATDADATLQAEVTRLTGEVARLRAAKGGATKASGAPARAETPTGRAETPTGRAETPTRPPRAAQPSAGAPTPTGPANKPRAPSRGRRPAARNSPLGS